MNMQSLVPWTRRAPTTWHRESDPFVALQSEMNRLFDDVFRGMGGRDAGFAGWPRVDVVDAGDYLRVDAELPGMREDDIEVTLKDGLLTLSGERKVESEDSDRRISERFFGRFARHVPLGFEIDEDNVTATFDNGELTIRLPKTETARSDVKRIEIGKTA